MRIAARVATPHTGNLFGCVLLGGDEETLATCAGDGRVCLHTPREGGGWVTRTLAHCNSRTKALEPAGPLEPFLFFAVEEGSSDEVPGRILGFDVRERRRSGESIVTPRGRGGWLEAKSVSASRDGHLLAVGCAGTGDEIVRLYDRRALSTRLAGESDAACALRFAPLHLAASRQHEHVTHVELTGGQLLASFHGDGVYLFDLEGGGEPHGRGSGSGPRGCATNASIGGASRTHTPGVTRLASGPAQPVDASITLRHALAAARVGRASTGSAAAVEAAMRDAVEALLARNWRGDGAAALAESVALCERGEPADASARLLVARALARCGQGAAGRAVARALQRSAGAGALAVAAAAMLESGALHGRGAGRGSGGAAGGGAGRGGSSAVGSGGDEESSSAVGSEESGDDRAEDASLDGSGEAAVLSSAPALPPRRPRNPHAAYPLGIRLALPGGAGPASLVTRHALRCHGARNRQTDIKEAAVWSSGRDLATSRARMVAARELGSTARQRAGRLPRDEDDGPRPRGAPIVAGSDDGHVFVWDPDGMLAAALQDDVGFTNAVRPHPTLPLLACSGFGDTIRLWAPGAEEADVGEALPARRAAAGRGEADVGAEAARHPTTRPAHNLELRALRNEMHEDHVSRSALFESILGGIDPDIREGLMECNPQ